MDLKSVLVTCVLLGVKREDAIFPREYMVVSRRARGNIDFDVQRKATCQKKIPKTYESI
jgi:hypothetical protein